ncbi:unnamed protein product [Linum tenue]|uniref:NAC domain-containing protein n=1 Tax=Linum tenue TaxID=586396 RepID=A0AAV0H8K7_9ROSI|nr:unnamed protein product [Linum tenue]
MEESLPPGFRFHPTDDELVSFYLTHKIADTSFTCKAMVDVDLNKNEPWDLPGKASMGEKEWYFFSLRDRKYPTGLRTNRATEAGYWKTTGKDKEIFSASATATATSGMKKTLVFYKGRAPRGEKTNWVMHEYRLHNRHRYKSAKGCMQEEWVVCRVFEKSSSSSAKKPQQASSSQHDSLASPSPSPCHDTNIEFGDMDFSHLNGNNAAFSSSSGGYNDAASPNYNHNAINIHHLLHHRDRDHDHNNNHSNNNNNNNNALLHMSAMNQAPSLLSSLLPWPANSASNLLGGASNLAMNSLLLKAFQLRSYQQREAAAAAAADYHHHHQQQQQHLGVGVGVDQHDQYLQGSPSASSRVLETAPQQQQVMPPQPDEEQPFNNMDSAINW